MVGISSFFYVHVENQPKTSVKTIDNVWQNPLQYCKVISLQLKNKWKK